MKKKIKLSPIQKVIAAAFILFTSLQGVLIHWYINKGNYFLICSPLLVLVWSYFGFIRMMNWAANNSINEKENHD